MNGILGSLFNGGNSGSGGLLGNMNPLTRLGLSLAGGNQGGGMQNLGGAFRGGQTGGGGGNYFQPNGLTNVNGVQGLQGDSQALNILRLLNGEGSIGILPRLHMG